MTTTQLPQRRAVWRPRVEAVRRAVLPSTRAPGLSTRIVLLLTAAAGLALSLIYLLLPAGGTDLSAQVERAQFARHHGLTPIDFNWYGGTNQFGYSLLSQFVMAAPGARLTGALAAFGTSLALAALLCRTQTYRPLLGSLAGAVCIYANLVSGRITYALGLCAAVAALAALTDNSPRRRLVLAGVAAFLAGAISPVAGLFLGLAGVALVCTGHRRDGIFVGLITVVPMGVISLVFGEGGWMNISASDTRHGVVLSLIVLVLVPNRTVRIGALLSAAGVYAAYLVHTPVGLNAIRLAVMFAIPVLIALLRWRLYYVVLAAVLVGWYQSPVNTQDLSDIGNKTARSSYFQPLIGTLQSLPPARVEIPPTRDYWESAHVARQIPLARGWLRQLDIDANPLFFDGSLDAGSYRRWLQHNGVGYIALPDTKLSWVGGGEKKLIDAGQPYLKQIWQDRHWRLYQVTGSPGIIDRPGRLVAADATGITVVPPAQGSTTVRIRYSRWLTVDDPDACLRPDGDWTVLESRSGRPVRISSSLDPFQSNHC